jgi:hypothetical protein
MTLLNFFVFGLHRVAIAQWVFVLTFHYRTVAIAKRFAPVSRKFVGGKIFLQLLIFTSSFGKPLISPFRVAPPEQLLNQQAIIQEESDHCRMYHRHFVAHDIA